MTEAAISPLRRSFQAITRTYYSFISPSPLEESNSDNFFSYLDSPKHAKHSSWTDSECAESAYKKCCRSHVESALKESSSGYESDLRTKLDKTLDLSNSDVDYVCGSPESSDQDVEPADGEDVAEITRCCSDLAKTICNAILEVCRADDVKSIKVRVLSKEDRVRLNFLRETLTMLLHFLNCPPKIGDQKVYCLLLTAFHRQLLETHEMLCKVHAGQFAITANFDIFELTLRRYLQQLQWMFPRSGCSSPVSRLADPKARKAWESSFGTACYVSFNEFVRMIQEQVCATYASNEKFLQFLQYFINFPSDDIITVYKWNQLICLFGPFDDFGPNFYRVALGRGFLGLINRVQAQEILSMEFGDRCLLVRFSRTQPEFLAFSYKDTTSSSGPVVGHKINKDSSGQPIPIDHFLRTNFTGYKLVSSRVNLSAILNSENSSLSQYAQHTHGYIAHFPSS